MSSTIEKREFSAMCRLCMDSNVLLVTIHRKGVKRSPGNILEVIEMFTSVKIDTSDSLPQKICESCIQAINSMLAFRNQCKRSDQELHKMIGKRTADEIEIGADSDTKENSDDGECGYRFDRSENERRCVNNTDEFEVKRSRPRKVACHICGKLYLAHEMKYHINEHNGLKPFKCNEPNCTSQFAGPYNLSKHKRFCHSLKPLLTCDVCGRGFKVKIGLEMHRSYHFDPNLPCKICEKLFRNKRALNKHMLVHTQDRQFKCETCGKSYQTRYTLRIHKRVHTQEKPYSCHCGVSFAYKCLLKTHTEKYHKLPQ